VFDGKENQTNFTGEFYMVLGRTGAVVAVRGSVRGLAWPMAWLMGPKKCHVWGMTMGICV
jgi:hypothetical protein